MKKLIPTTIILCTVLLTWSANGADDSKVKKETKEAVEASTEYAHATKEEFQEKMRANVKSVEAEIKALEEKTKTATATTKEKINGEIKNLKSRREELNLKLEELKTSSSRAWDDMRSGIVKAWRELKSATQDAASQFKN